MTFRVPAYVTRAAEGLGRRRFTVAEFEAMVAAGIINLDERLELIGGELVPMELKGPRHDPMLRALVQRWTGLADGRCRVIAAAPFPLSLDTFVAPDLVVVPETVGAKQMGGEDAWLVVEIAEGSRRFDMGRKAKICGRHGVRELWVIDAARMNARLFREPYPGGYAETRDYDFDEAIIPAFAPPEFALRLDALDLR